MASPPALENRTLRISLDSPALEYQFFECTKRILFICTKQELRKEIYDLTKPEVRKQLIDMGFVAKVRDKP
jgi:hypothetical protein